MQTSTAARLDSFLRRDAQGELLVEDVSVAELAARHGTPLHVVSEARLREDFRRIRDAFAARWPAGVEVCYAIKANPALAIRRVLADEGAHGDCLGLHELHASLLAGTPGSTLVLNGNNKADEALLAAVRCGARINVDDADEPARIQRLARAQERRVPVGIRTKPDPAPLGERPTDLAAGTVSGYVERSKWGLEPADTVAVARALLAMPELELTALHCHLGRHVPEPELFGELAGALAAALARLRAEAGWSPRVLTVGGGFTQGRDPYFRKPRDGAAWPRAEDCFVAPIEAYAEALCARLGDELDARGLDAPVLGLEPGRYIAGSAGLTVTRVGTVKATRERRWVEVDAAISQLGMSRSPSDAHALVPVRERGGEERPVDVVGPLCVLDVIAEQVALAPLEAGDLLAVLDTGAYADGEASNANSIGRPAVVLVSGAHADLVRRRETFADVFARDAIPVRLLGTGAAAPPISQAPPP
jgi:diaminopimelate decarboxylase